MSSDDARAALNRVMLVEEVLSTDVVRLKNTIREWNNKLEAVCKGAYIGPPLTAMEIRCIILEEERRLACTTFTLMHMKAHDVSIIDIQV